MASEAKKMKVLLFSGKAEHGKTSAANITEQLLKDLGYAVGRVAYGDYVKLTAKELFGWNGIKDEQGRKMLQWWGADKVRKDHPSFWVDSVMRLVNVVRNDFDYIIIDDVRYENEITCWYGFGATTIPVRVVRPGHESSLTKEQREHVSETDLDDWNFKIRIEAEDMHQLLDQIKTVLMPVLTGDADA